MAELKFAKNLPADVERYADEGVAEGLPESEAWAVAWSRYCKKHPNSPHCHKDKYAFIAARIVNKIARSSNDNAADMDILIRAQFLEGMLCHEPNSDIQGKSMSDLLGFIGKATETLGMPKEHWLSRGHKLYDSIIGHIKFYINKYKLTVVEPEDMLHDFLSDGGLFYTAGRNQAVNPESIKKINIIHPEDIYKYCYSSINNRCIDESRTQARRKGIESENVNEIRENVHFDPKDSGDWDDVISVAMNNPKLARHLLEWISSHAIGRWGEGNTSRMMSRYIDNIMSPNPLNDSQFAKAEGIKSPHITNSRDRLITFISEDAAKNPESYMSAMKGLLDNNAFLHQLQTSSVRTAAVRVAAAFTLLAKVKKAVNAGLVKKGLDGNGRFEKPVAALSAANEVLAAHGLEMAETLDSFRLSRPEGRMTITIASTNKDEPLSPIGVKNSVLVLQWSTFKETGKVEVISYLS